MSKKKHRDKPAVQKIKEDPVWHKRAEFVIQNNIMLRDIIAVMLKELKRVYKGVQG